MKIDFWDDRDTGMWLASFPFGDLEGELHIAEADGMSPGDCLRNLATEVDRILAGTVSEQPQHPPKAKSQRPKAGVTQ